MRVGKGHCIPAFRLILNCSKGFGTSGNPGRALKLRRMPMKSNSRGFTLIELLIAIAIIGILAAIIIPAYKGSIRKANEAAAAAAVNTIKIAEAKYSIDHNGQYGTFAQLFAEDYLDKRFNTDQPHVRGYIFMLTLIDNPQKPAVSFHLNA